MKNKISNFSTKILRVFLGTFTTQMLDKHFFPSLFLLVVLLSLKTNNVLSLDLNTEQNGQICTFFYFKMF